MLWTLIMAGGRGTRLWPLADGKTPKPLLKLIPGQPSLLRQTLDRLKGLVPPERIWVFTGQEYLEAIRRSSKGIPEDQVVGEPAARNTAPTIALAASLILSRDPQAQLLVLPADHWIDPKTKFHQTVRTALALVSQTQAFAIVGIPPDFPSTSYGYLTLAKKVRSHCYQLKRFVEKPNLKRAQKLVREGCLWHAGIFLAPVRAILNELRRYAPAIREGAAKLEVREGRVVPERIFKSLPDISMDYAVHEKLREAYVVRGEFKWHDIGIWKSFEALWPQDRFGNAVYGTSRFLNASKNIVYSKAKPMCLVDVNDLVVVDTPHVILVAKKSSSEDIRKAAEMSPSGT